MKKKELKFLIPLFLIWKSYLIFAVIFSFFLFPVFSKNFFGGGLKYYSIFPWVYGWANFDGEHYVSIALAGYQKLESAFFPVYPKLISFFLQFFTSSIFNASLIGQIISTISFFFALIFLYKVLRIDYDDKKSLGVILTIILFPTSFFFQAVYNESLFLLFAVLSFYFARKGDFFWASLFGMILSATRVFGILLFPSLLLEAHQQKAKWYDYLKILIVPFGLLLYMFYLWKTFLDPITFYHNQIIVGQQHQIGIVTYPQVLARYLRIFSTVNVLTLSTQSLILEFFTGVMFLILPLVGFFKKIRFSYLFYSFFGFLIPTIQGSFSSLPRYVLVLFPSFIILYLVLERFPGWVKLTLVLLSFILLGFEAGLFIRGYWVA